MNNSDAGSAKAARRAGREHGASFAALLGQAWNAHRLRVERALAELSVTPPQFSVLTLIAAHPGCSNADLARHTLLTPQTVSVIVANLGRMGAVARVSHATHRKIQQLSLTPEGEAILDRCRAQTAAIEAALGEKLKPRWRKRLRKWLKRVARAGAGA